MGLAFLSSCSAYLNMSPIENRIQDDIERQGRRLSLKSVVCPNRVVKQAEAYFRCVGELPDGAQFTINVIQQDDQGNVAWDVPSSKALINLASLEEKIRSGTQAAVGKRLAIDCGPAYRISRRGDSFECDVVGAGTVAAGRVESILVRVSGDGNLEWQEVIVGAAPAAASPAATAGESAPTAAASGETSGEPAPAPPTAAAAQGADDGE